MDSPLPTIFRSPRKLDLYMLSWKGIGHVMGCGGLLLPGKSADFVGIVPKSLHDRQELFLELRSEDKERFILIRDISECFKRHYSWWSCARRNNLAEESDRVECIVSRDLRVHLRAKLCLA